MNTSTIEAIVQKTVSKNTSAIRLGCLTQYLKPSNCSARYSPNDIFCAACPVPSPFFCVFGTVTFSGNMRKISDEIRNNADAANAMLTGPSDSARASFIPARPPIK